MVPTRNPIELVMTNTLPVNNRKGMMGSGVRVSCHKKAMSRTTAAPISASTDASVHPRRPRSSPSTSDPRQPDSNAAPRKSMRALRRRNSTVKLVDMAAKATMASGTLNRKIHSQAKRSIIHPPTSGPMTAEAA